MLNTKLLGGTASAPAVYVDDVFSTYLYTGTGATQTINNGIDLAGKGGLVWAKSRSNAYDNNLADTVRGNTKLLFSNTTNGNFTSSDSLTSFNNNGFTLGADTASGGFNNNTYTYCSWTFREQAKFFDVVTFTATGSSQVITHNLGSTPGMIFFKRTDGASNWVVWHRSLAAQHYLKLNATDASADLGGVWCTPTSTNTTVDIVFGAGQTWVAYLFAHNAGGFGTAGTDNVISCGSFTSADSSGGATVNLGYEPQFVLIKSSDLADPWFMLDNIRGLPVGANNQALYANTSAAETSNSRKISLSATGFNASGGWADGYNFIYMAIRRPMKPPTSGTEVFSPITSSATTGTVLTTGFPIDFQIETQRPGGDDRYVIDRLRGINTTGATGQTVALLRTNVTDAQQDITTLTASNSWNNTSFKLPSNFNGISSVYYSFRRASGFFDVVCYTGTGSARTVAHNLGVAPELMIVKSRSNTTVWYVYQKDIGATRSYFLNTDGAGFTSTTYWNDTAPTSSVFTVGASTGTNNSGSTYVAYLFASVAGVSKVGSYTGNGSSQTINCGFTAGARFVMVKRTDSTGDWVVLDTARGIVSGNDPFLELNTTAAEQTGEDIVDPANSGFIVNSTTENINASGGTYIYLAIA